MLRNCALQECQPLKVGGTKHWTSPPLQKVGGGHVPLSTHGSTPMGIAMAYRGLLSIPQDHSPVEGLKPCEMRFFVVFKRPLQVTVALCYGTLSCLSVTLVYCGQTVGLIEMPFGTEVHVGLGPGDIVRWGPSLPTERGTAAPPLLCPCLSC